MNASSTLVLFKDAMFTEKDGSTSYYEAEVHESNIDFVLTDETRKYSYVHLKSNNVLQIDLQRQTASASTDTAPSE